MYYTVNFENVIHKMILFQAEKNKSIHSHMKLWTQARLSFHKISL